MNVQQEESAVAVIMAMIPMRSLGKCAEKSASYHTTRYATHENPDTVVVLFLL